MRTLLTSLLSLFFAVSCFAQTATKSTLYAFKDADGDDPATGVIQASDGNFYGSAPGSGLYGGGTIYEITADGTFSTIYNFNPATDGGGPNAIIQGPDGYLYGVTDNYGPSGSQTGTIFKVSLSGQLTVLYSFADGSNTYAGLTLGADGNFYGVMTNGGTYGGGSIFKMTPSGTFTTLYTFTGILDGGNPYTSLLQASDGNFYGIATNGGANGGGTLFQITPTGTFKVIYAFDPSVTGLGLQNALVQGADGALYESTLFGGPNGFGSIVKITLDGTLSTVYNFTNGADGSQAWAPLLLGGDGNFYGGTRNNSGTIFRLTPSGAITTLYSFLGGVDGDSPVAPLIQGADGNLYGVALYGGQYTDGTVFKLTFSSPVAPSVLLSTSKTSIPLGSSTTLSWSSPTAYSVTAQQCFAAVQSGTDPTWTGTQTGAVTNGVYSGSATITPTSEGSVTYALTCGGIQTSSTTVTVTAPLPLSITTTSLPNATVGTSYSTTLAATGGVAPYSWTETGALPAGITLSSAGVLSGTPTANGVFPITVSVADAEGTPLTATASYSLTVSTATPTMVATPSTVTVTAPGGNGTTSLSLSGFSNTSMTFACSGLPHDALCSFGTISGSGAAATATLTITTAAAAVATVHEPALFGRHEGPLTVAFVLPGVALFFGFSKRRRKLNAGALAVLIAAVLTLGAMSGCSNSSGNVAPDQGTPVGTSTVTITATSGSQTATTTVSLNVQ